MTFATGCAAPTHGDRQSDSRPITVSASVPTAPSHRPLTWRRIPSTIVTLDADGQPMIPNPSVEHAREVKAGRPLMVTVRSFGGGCEAAGGADGSTRESEVDIRPWDYTHVPAGPAGLEYVCTVPLNIFKRTVSVVFDRPGAATIRVHGIRNHGREPERAITLTSTVQVR